MSKYAEDQMPICARCDRKDETKVCLRCSIVFCQHFASPTDYRYCGNCLADFTIKETIMEKIIDRQKSDGTYTHSRKFLARHIKLEGTDWLFAIGLISDKSDEELDSEIEYHKANVDLLLQEREARKLERIKKLASIKLPSIKHETQEQREKREAREAAAKGKRTRVNDKAPVTVEALAALLSKIGGGKISPEKLTEMLANAGKETK